jgi:SSS family solute:Na+ symporter
MAPIIDIVAFFLFLIAVLVIGIGMSRRGKGAGADSESYFLAGRGLAWWIIGVSLISANISTEQFVGMSGNAADYIGLAVASYEWIAALSLVIVGFVFLPRFLKAGVYTIPQFLETRYNKAAQSLMAITMVAVLVCVNIAVIIYSGALAYSEFFKDPATNAVPIIPIGTWEIDLLTAFCWVLGILAASYVFIGGLKACAWADLLQGSALILCGIVILLFAFHALGKADKDTLNQAIQANAEQLKIEISPEEQAATLAKLEQSGAYERFTTLNEPKLRMNLPWSDTFLPITALIFAIWIPNLYYWGLNQYIMQRALGSQSLAQGQKGIIFAAFLKLLIPFIVIFPGIMAYNLYNDKMKDNAYKEAVRSARQFDATKFDELATTYTNENKLFSFDTDFVRFHPDAAQKMVKFNADRTGYTIPEKFTDNPLEALAAMQEEPVPQFGRPLQTYGETYTGYGYQYDSAFPLLVRELIPSGGLRGFMLAALFGMIVSTLAAMFNATSTIFTMDIYKGHLHKGASEKVLVWIGRIAVILCMLAGCCIAPMLADPRFGGVFWFIQEFQGYISPGVLAAFLFGFLVRKAPRMCGVTALLLNPIIYYLLMQFAGHLSFLDRMGITFVVIIAVMALMTILKPLKESFKLEAATTIDLRWSKSALLLGFVVVAITIFLYVHFWDHTTAMFEGFW